MSWEAVVLGVGFGIVELLLVVSFLGMGSLVRKGKRLQQLLEANLREKKG